MNSRRCIFFLIEDLSEIHILPHSRGLLHTSVVYQTGVVDSESSELPGISMRAPELPIRTWQALSGPGLLSTIPSPFPGFSKAQCANPPAVVWDSTRTAPRIATFEKWLSAQNIPL